MNEQLNPSTKLAGKRVLVLTDAYPVPSQTFIVDHLRALCAAGLQVTLMTRRLNHAAPPPPSLQEFPLRLLQTPFFSMGSLTWLLRLLCRRPSLLLNRLLLRCSWHAARLVSSGVADADWDVVHAHFGNNGIVALLAKPEWTKCLLVNFHGHDATALPRRYGWNAYRTSLGSSNAIVHSQFLAERLAAHTQLQMHRVEMGVDMARFSARRRGETWPRPVHFLFIGRLVPQKGADVAVKSLATLRSQHPELDARLTLVGTGPEAPALRMLISELGLTAVVGGPAGADYERVPDLLSGADIILMPSQKMPDGSEEAFGRVAIEAMAAGVPVVACPSGGLAATVGQGGVIADGFDSDSVCAAIRTVLRDGTPASWRQAAVQQAQGHDISKMDADYLSVTWKLIARNCAS